MDEAHFPAWEVNSTYSCNFLDMVLLSDESILEDMIGPNKISKDLHQNSYFPLELRIINNSEFHLRLSEGVSQSLNPLPNEGVFTKGNMENISETIPIIFTKPGIVENVYIGENSSPKETSIYTSLFKEFRNLFSWSYKDMSSIDQSIVEHDIKMYPNIKPMWKKIRPFNPQKVAAVKDEVEKMLKVGFICPISLMEWVSNPVLMEKN